MSEPEHQRLDREAILAQLSRNSRGWLRELQIHAEIDSTNSHLMSRAANEAVDGLACFAERQTGGRGRRGRTWLTPPGSNIALSLGKSLSVSVADVAPLSLVVGLAVVKALDRVGVKETKLKWPNDILLNGAKVGGILIELAGIASPLAIVVGVGINIGSGAEVSAHLGSPVGDLTTSGVSVPRNTLAAQLIDCVYDMTTQFEVKRFSPMRSEWEARHAHQNRSVRVIGVNETIEGIARGVTDRGELILETATGIRYFTGGEVSLRGENGSS